MNVVDIALIIVIIAVPMIGFVINHKRVQLGKTCCDCTNCKKSCCNDRI